MILSMTGFAAASRDIPGGALNLELRAVNHRYLDVQMRLPEELRVIEPHLREMIAAKVSRGKIECRIGLHQIESDAPTLELNQEYLARLLTMGKEIQAQSADLKGLSVGELLRWPGVLKSNVLPIETLQQLALEN